MRLNSKHGWSVLAVNENGTMHALKGSESPLLTNTSDETVMLLDFPLAREVQEVVVEQGLDPEYEPKEVRARLEEFLNVSEYNLSASSRVAMLRPAPKGGNGWGPLRMAGARRFQ